MQIIIQIALVRLLLRTRPLTKLQSILPTGERTGHCVGEGGEENGKIRCAAASWRAHAGVRCYIALHAYQPRERTPLGHRQKIFDENTIPIANL